MASPSLYQLRSVFLLFCFALLSVACEKDTDTSEIETIVIPQLNDGNIHAFTLSFAKEYFATEKSLIIAFNSYKEAKDAYGFTLFRNKQWTPEYIERKDYYHSVLEQNKQYITGHAIAPLFDAFENLIYIGLGLKNSLLNNDSELLEKSVISLKADRKTVRAAVKSLK